MERLKKIQKKIQDYYEMSFESEKEDCEYNKRLKNELKQLIIDLKDENLSVINEILLVLAKSTGCAEDQEIADDIINYLHNNNFINDKHVEFFYNHIATGRWT
ncbi:hypothetical protein [Tenacibaculum sp. SDUM215027]|uniref:hypothetical protein n=1 Tax=Tenacibaculum sp. SDUM215027 TaxID=3422596 RepID=UPI003D3192D6